MSASLAAVVLLVSAAATPGPVGPLVYVDPGHGGRMEGAQGEKHESEKVIALQIAQRLKEVLQARLGARVVLTREADDDVELAQRMSRANAAKADLFISVHCNSMPPGPARRSAKGVETYFLSAEATGEQADRVARRENSEARAAAAEKDALAGILSDLAQTEAHHGASALAYAVHQRAVKELAAADRGVHQAPFIVLMGAQMPAILVEVGFLSHPVEAQRLAAPAYQERVAQAVASGVAAYLKETVRTPVQAEPPAHAATPP